MARDRIISGLSQAVIIVEAGINSGSLDTAARAKEQGRLVYAVPGSKGTDQLIEKGARVIDPTRISFQTLIEEMSSAQDINPNLQPKQSSFF
jgi:DNA processing protein